LKPSVTLMLEMPASSGGTEPLLRGVDEGVPFTESTASVLLDAIRGTAAFIVLIEHWRNLFFIDYAQLGRHHLWLIPFYLFTGGGHQAVLVFFILSGFLISSSIFKARMRDSWSWRTYMVHRVTRLVVALVPALLLGFFWDSLGSHLEGSRLFYQGATPTGHMIQDVRETLSLETFLGNLAFLQTIRVPVLGTNGALWSLANEFWYYVLFPLVLIALTGPGKITMRVVQGLGFFSLACFVGKNILFGFPIWLAGVLLFKTAHSRRPHRRWLTLLLPGYLAVFFARLHDSPLQQLVLTIYTFLLLWLVLCFRGRSDRPIFNFLSRQASGFSYTLYLVHTPPLAFCASLLTRGGRWYPDLLHLSIAALILLATVAYAYVVACIAEFKTANVRRWAESHLGLARAKPILCSVSVPQ
jgi:peptidoglycan/LPS O-acetylase OafA/YrhL